MMYPEEESHSLLVFQPTYPTLLEGVCPLHSKTNMAQF